MENFFANENDTFIIFYFWQITCPRQPSKLCRPCSSSWQFSPQCFLEAKYGQVFSHVFTTSIFLKFTKFHKILTWIVDFTWFSPVFARQKPNLKIVRAVDQKKRQKNHSHVKSWLWRLTCVWKRITARHSNFLLSLKWH